MMVEPMNAVDASPGGAEIQHYDAIVVGSGLGGLTVAATLARRGRRVLVVERHKVLGGYASVFGRAGATFDTSLHLLGGAKKTLVAEILKDAGVYDKLNFVKPEHLSELQLEPGGEIIAIPNGDMRAYQDWLCQRFPDEKGAIGRWFWFMRRYGRQIALNDRVRRMGAVRQGIWLYFYPLLAPFLVASRFAVPRLSIAMGAKDPELRALLLHFSGYYGLPHSEINALFAMAGNYSYYHDGGYYLEGGGFAITRQLSLVVRRNGGKIITGHAVERIETEGDAVTGVSVEGDATRYEAPEIVCSANPFTTYRTLLAHHSVASSELARISRMDLSMTACVLYLHIDVPVGQLNEALAQSYEYVLTPDGPEEAFFDRFRNRSDFEDDYARDGIALTFHSHLDPHAGGADEGGTVFDLFYADNFDRWDALGEDEYQRRKEIEKEKMLDRLETVLPGVRAHIVSADLATPITMRNYTGNEGGALYGFSQVPSQAGDKRFAIQGPLRGLSFVSAWSDPGGGYEGVLRGAENYLYPRKPAARAICAGLIAASIAIPVLLALL